MTFPFPLMMMPSGSSAILARYWRVYITDNNGDAYDEIPSVEFYENFQTGIASLAGGSSFESSFYAAGYEGSKVFDGNTPTVWISATGAGYPQWVGYDYGPGRTVNVNTVAITGANGNPNRSPKDFDIQYSFNGSTWFTAWSVTGSTGWTGLERRTFYDTTVDPVYANPKRMWRVYITETNSPNLAEITELRFNNAAGTNAPLTGSAFASSQNGGSVASNAFDSNNGTFWTSLAMPPDAWLAYDFGAGNNQDIVETDITFFGAGRCPKTFKIEYSGDGLRWKGLWNYFNNDYWPGGLRRFKKPAGPYDAKRMWRIFVTATASTLNPVELGTLEFLRADNSVAPTDYQPIKSSEFSGNIVDNAFDGSPTTIWSTAGSTANEFIGYDFGVQQEITKVRLTANTPGRAPKDFLIQYSSDNITWTTEWSVSGETGWGVGEVRTFTKP